MRHTPQFVIEDPDEVRRLVQQHPWATFVSATSSGLVASHYPVLVDDSASDLVVLSHFGRPDDVLHELGRHEVLVIVQGPHDYVSPSWYPPGEVIGTWNHVTAHLYGTPVLLSEEENYTVLGRLTDHFERHQEHGRSLSDDEAHTRRVAKGTVGLRMSVDRFEARAKLSQDKPAAVRDTVTAQLADRNPALADEMRRHADG